MMIRYENALHAIQYQPYLNYFQDAKQNSQDTGTSSMPQIEVDKKHADVAEEFLKKVKEVYNDSYKKLSGKNIKPRLPSKIRLQELPGEIGFEKYIKQEKGKLYIFIVPHVEKVFGYYNPETNEAVIDPLLLKDTEFSKLMKKYGLEIRQPSLREVLTEELILHPLQKDAGLLDRSEKYKYGKEAVEGLTGALKEYLGIDVTAYPYETCMMRRILKDISKKYGLNPSGILTSPYDMKNDGQKKDISPYHEVFEEFGRSVAECYEEGKCSCS